MSTPVSLHGRERNQFDHDLHGMLDDLVFACDDVVIDLTGTSFAIITDEVDNPVAGASVHCECLHAHNEDPDPSDALGDIGEPANDSVVTEDVAFSGRRPKHRRRHQSAAALAPTSHGNGRGAERNAVIYMIEKEAMQLRDGL